MELDVREILFNWINREPYYGNVRDCESAWLASRGGRKAGYSRGARGVGSWNEEVVYEDSEDRWIGWIDIDLALRRIQSGHRRALVEYLIAHKEIPYNDWEPLPTDLWIEISLALSGVILEAASELKLV